VGIKSGLKKKKSFLLKNGISNSFARRLVAIDQFNEPIYRFFSDKWQADALSDGNVWISTLETCRQYEDPLQGDADEATETYSSGHIIGGSNDPIFVEMASKSGIHIGEGCSNITISNCSNIKRLSDSFVLCTTKEFNPDMLSSTFGTHCVRILNPKEFFEKISIKLNQNYALKDGLMGQVIYKSRTYTGSQQNPGPLGFVKPQDEYSAQKEFRFLWVPYNSNNLKPFLLQCPEVSHLCEVVS